MGFSYKNSKIHRIIPEFVVHGGDITKGNGKGGKSIYGPTFDDETFEHRHLQAGVLSMANYGPNTNGSQFFVTLASTPWLDKKFVAFGKVSSGLTLLKTIASYGTESGVPTAEIIISECGLI